MRNSFKNPLYAPGVQLASIKELIVFAAGQYGTKAAFRYKKEDQIIIRTYAELYRDVKLQSGLFKSLNLPRKHIAIIGKTSYEWIVTYLSIMYSGMVAVPIDTQLLPQEYGKLLKRADVDCVVCEKKLKSSIDDLQLTGSPSILCMDEEKTNADAARELLSDEISDQIDVNALAVIVFTSGTTGESKGVMLSQKNIMVDVQSASQILGLSEQDSSLSILPLYHSYEMTCDILLLMYFGASVSLNDSLKYMSRNLKIFRPSVLFAVPMVVESIHRSIMEAVRKSKKEKLFYLLLRLSAILNKAGIHCSRSLFKNVRKELGGELRLMISGGAYLDQIYIDFFDNIGINLVQGYGITECAPLLSANPDRFKKRYSIGRIVTCCEVAIDKNDTYEKADGHAVGEIMARGANVMLGYYKDEKSTSAAMREGWFKTGDIGWIDQDNYLYITGRIKNLMVLSNGKNVSPEEIEQKLFRLPVVKEVQVVSTKEGYREEIMAVIFPDETYIEENAITDVKKYAEHEVNNVNKELPAYMQVTKVVLRDSEFPKTSTRKIKRMYTTEEAQ